MQISIFGLGYVGCVTAACLAKAGHEVIGVDVNAEKVGMINAGVSPIIEPGLGDLLADMLRNSLGENLDEAVSVAVNPEFMREGSSLSDFDHPPFTLVGCADADTAGLIRTLYGQIDALFVHTSVRVAEMTKYVCNAFHALKICFANEIGDLCECLGVNP